jgi:hypothetical protein
MEANTIKQVRTLNHHLGRLPAIKFLRTVLGLPYLVAKLAVDDIVTNKPWTKPEIKPDLNTWEYGYEIGF